MAQMAAAMGIGGGAGGMGGMPGMSPGGGGQMGGGPGGIDLERLKSLGRQAPRHGIGKARRPAGRLGGGFPGFKK